MTTRTMYHWHLTAIAIGLALWGCDTETSGDPTAKKPATTKTSNTKTKTSTKAKGASTKGASPRTTSVTIKVADKKANGKKWDMVGAKPDIGLCVTVNGKDTCFSKGKPAAKVKKPTCKNAEVCTFENVPIAGSKIKFRIVDVDVGKQDLIGEGECSTAKSTCTVGLAEVTIVRPLTAAEKGKGLAASKATKKNKKRKIKKGPPPIPNLAAKKLPKKKKLIGKTAACKLAKAPKMKLAKKAPKYLRKAKVDTVFLEAKCAGAKKRNLSIFAARDNIKTLFEISKGSVVHVQVKKKGKKSYIGLLEKIIDGPKAWWPKLPPSPRLAKGFAKADAAHQKAVKALKKKNTKKITALAKEQAKALVDVPTKHKKARGELLKRHKSEIAEAKKEVNDAIKEMNNDIAEQKKECRSGDAEDRKYCMDEVKESQAENDESIKEKRKELKETLSTMAKEHSEALKDHDDSLPTLKGEARRKTGLAIYKLQQKVNRQIAKLEQKRNASLGKKYRLYGRYVALINRLKTVRKTELPAKLAAALVAGQGEAMKYPAPCKGLDMSRHVEIRKDKGWCVPTFPGYALLAGAKQFTGLGETYDDDHPLVVMGRPDKRADETSEISTKERNKRVAQAKKDVYFSLLNSECTGGYDESPNRLNMTCNLTGENLYTSNPPKITKKQECDTTTPARCVDRCNEDSDCRGFTCGCRQSKCSRIFRVCTKCPPETICPDPEFTMGETSYSNAQKQTGAAQDIAREISLGLGNYRAVMGFKGQSVWRKLDTKKECETDYDGKKECTTTVQHNSGYWLKTDPLFLGYAKCRDAACKQPMVDGVAVRSRNFSVTLSNRGHSARVTGGNTCTAVKAK
ncbi:MAG: hypothetical protein VX589_01025 [Myxococcota bacterium]|nr:hypothetical protein [Myxococcota bacterium]